MKLLYTRLQEARARLGIPWEILERDYILSWVLAGIANTETLRDTLVFKGGTALKKCYFGDYRFSEDLDFSTVGDAFTGSEMEYAVRVACNKAAELLDEYAPVEIQCERYVEKHPHPGGQEAFSIRARLPWHRQLQTRVLVEISIDEKVIKPIQSRKVIHHFDEILDAAVNVYSLEEIVGEKLRAILQHAEKLEERGWSRSRARDYYDLWRILGVYKKEMNLTGFPVFLKDKCAVRNVAFESSDDFFQEKVISYVERTWDQWLGPLVPELPSFTTVMDELRPQIEIIISQ